MNNLLSQFCIGISLSAIFITGIVLFYSADIPNPTYIQVCEKELIVMSVGGCDRSGQCGVMLSDSTTMILGYPVVGQPVCFKYIRKVIK